MAKRKLKEQEIIEHLLANGFKTIGGKEKSTAWYKKAVEKPECLNPKAAKLCIKA